MQLTITWWATDPERLRPVLFHAADPRPVAATAVPERRRRSVLAQRLPACIREARVRAAAEAPLDRREQRDDTEPVARVERFLRAREHVAHLVGVQLASAGGDQVFPQLRLVVEEAPAAAAQHVGEAGEFGEQQV